MSDGLKDIQRDFLLAAFAVNDSQRDQFSITKAGERCGLNKDDALTLTFTLSPYWVDGLGFDSDEGFLTNQAKTWKMDIERRKRLNGVQPIDPTRPMNQQTVTSLHDVREMERKAAAKQVKNKVEAESVVSGKTPTISSMAFIRQVSKAIWKYRISVGIVVLLLVGSVFLFAPDDWKNVYVGILTAIILGVGGLVVYEYRNG